MGHVEPFFQLAIRTTADANQRTICIEQSATGTTALRIHRTDKVGWSVVAIDVDDLCLQQSRVSSAVATKADKVLILRHARSSGCQPDCGHNLRGLNLQKRQIGIVISTDQRSGIAEWFAVLENFDFNLCILRRHIQKDMSTRQNDRLSRSAIDDRAGADVLNLLAVLR